MRFYENEKGLQWLSCFVLLGSVCVCPLERSPPKRACYAYIQIDQNAEAVSAYRCPKWEGFLVKEQQQQPLESSTYDIRWYILGMYNYKYM